MDVAEPASFPFDAEALLERCADNEIIEIPCEGVVIRGVLDESEQRSLYEYMWDLSAGTDAHSELQRVVGEGDRCSPEEQEAARRVPMPIVYWTHPYSRSSSVPRPPEGLLKWAGELLRLLAPGAGRVQVDSMLAQVYFARGFLGPHLDRDLSWGLGLSLGASALLRCWHHGDPVPQDVVLHSGDVVVGEFGRMLHSVEVLGDDTLPAWWREARTLGRARCNVLFRQALTEEQQRELSEPRAQALYGKGLDAVAADRGKPLGEVALALRHEMDAYVGTDVR